jgi:hypothetical protein
VVADVEFLAQEFQPFELTAIRLEHAFPDAESMSLVAEDASGSLEALHHELVHRAYRRAAASDYTLDSSLLTRGMGSRRHRMMIRRYKAPYILQGFRPHLTLLSSVPPDEQPRFAQELADLFSQQVPDRTIQVSDLVIVSRASPESRYVIEREIRLG